MDLDQVEWLHETGDVNNKCLCCHRPGRGKKKRGSELGESIAMVVNDGAKT